jgi:hypothetical protein
MINRRLLFAALLIVSLLALVAWTRIYAGTPYTGVMWLSSVTNGLRSNVRNVIWDSTGVNEIRNNGYFEEYDQTAGRQTTSQLYSHDYAKHGSVCL